MPLPRDERTPGLVVAGAGTRCGKTVACAGLAGAMGALGFRVQAIKPFVFEPRVALRHGHDQAFFDKVQPPLQAVEVFSAESAFSAGLLQWNRLLETCRGMAYPYILEYPGTVATPLRFADDEALDAVDVAQALGVPLLVAVAKQPDLIGAMLPVLNYLWYKDAASVGWVAVETAPSHLLNWEDEIIYLSRQHPIPYLGEIAYSPSISVEALQQGNIIRNTESGIDLLPLQQALGVTVP